MLYARTDFKSDKSQGSGRTTILFCSEFEVLTALISSAALLAATVLRHAKTMHVTELDLTRNWAQWYPSPAVEPVITTIFVAMIRFSCSCVSRNFSCKLSEKCSSCRNSLIYFRLSIMISDESS
jgi:hypothetical protein